jgi:two-component sensor histidine kinase
MKKIILLILVLILSQPVLAKKRSKASLQVDYATLTAETVINLNPNTEYNIIFINLPSEITSTKLRKQFKRTFIDISSSRRKVYNSSSTHRVRTFKVYNDLLSTKLNLYKKIKSKRNSKTDDDKDNILVSSVSFNFTVPTPAL